MSERIERRPNFNVLFFRDLDSSVISILPGFPRKYWPKKNLSDIKVPFQQFGHDRVRRIELAEGSREERHYFSRHLRSSSERPNFVDSAAYSGSEPSCR
jgi:hypothetical protein